MAEVVRCRDCGFLAMRNVETRKLEEAEETLRNTGQIPAQHRMKRHESLPVCFMAAVNLRAEATGEDPVHVLEIVNRERQCAAFTNWNVGYTPKEHREMLDRGEERRQRRIDAGLLALVAGLFTILGVIVGVVLSGS